MSEKRIPCPNCGTPILEVTAKYNDGMCAPCSTKVGNKLRSKQNAEARRNAPPPPINYRKFTEEEFIQGLKKICAPLKDNPSNLAIEFLGFCDPITQRPSQNPILAMLFSDKVLNWGFGKIPRPYRECLAVYHAWGMVGSDGFESYLGQTNKKFDDEVELGLERLGQLTPRGVIAEARKAYQAHSENLPEDIESNLWNRFYDPMKRFEEILGNWLIAELFGKAIDR